MLELKKNSLKMLLLVVSAFTLTACTKGISNENSEKLILPTMFEYTRAEQELVAEELESGACNASDKFIEDYGIVRQQIRRAIQ